MTARLIQRLENAWWESEEVVACGEEVTNKGLNPDDMRFFGEIGFVECGAKPLAILSGLPGPCTLSYVHRVLEPSGLVVLPSGTLPSPSSSSKLHAGILPSDFSTPNYDLSGSIYVCNPAHTLFTKVREMLGKTGQVSEAEMAEVLDYPCALPDEGIGEDEYVEVGYLYYYFHITVIFFDWHTYVEEATKILLMSYGVNRREFDNTKEKIKSHFARYAACTHDIFHFTVHINKG